MTKSTIQYTKGISEIVNDRSRVWEDYDNLLKRVEEFNTLSQKVPELQDASNPLLRSTQPTGSSSAENISHLTSHNTPPSEIIQTIAELHKEFKNIENAQSRIALDQAEIQKIKQRMMWIYISVGVAIIVILFLVVSALSQR